MYFQLRDFRYIALVLKYGEAMMVGDLLVVHVCVLHMLIMQIVN